MITQKELNVGDKVWGHAYEITLDQPIDSENDAFQRLDVFCSNNELNELKATWKKISLKDAKALLKNCLTYDIAYSSSRINGQAIVEILFTNLMSIFNGNDIQYCFSNCFGTPWDQNKNGYSWNNLTKYTFDIGVVIIDEEKILFAYFMSED